MESHYHHCPQLHPPPISASSHFSWVSHLSYNYMHLIDFYRQVKKLIPVCLWLNLSWQVLDTMQPICPTHSLLRSLSCVATLSPLGGWARLAHMQEVFDISSLLKTKKRSSIWPINNYKYPLGHVLTTENDRRELSSTAEPLKFGYRRLRQLVDMHSLIHSSFPLITTFLCFTYSRQLFRWSWAPLSCFLRRLGSPALTCRCSKLSQSSNIKNKNPACTGQLRYNNYCST